jgi:hypothetical protein
MFTIDFEKGIEAAQYIENLRYYKSVVRSLVTEAEAEADHISRLADAVKERAKPIRATAMTEDWCGDSACNIPILTSLFSSAAIPFLIFHGSEYREFEKYYNDQGIDHIPVISIWDGKGEEIGRWIEQPRKVIPMKDAWKAERPGFMDLYKRREKDKEAGRQFAKLYREFLEEMAGWYIGGMWTETTREIVETVGG